MSNGKTMLFVVLICFWTVLTMLSNVFWESLVINDIESLRPDQSEYSIGDFSGEQEEGFLANLFTTITEIPIIKVFKPLLQIMSFQYTNQVSPGISLFLNMTLIFTGYVVYNMFRGN